MNKKGLTLVQFAGAVIVLCIIIFILWPQFEKVIKKSKYNTFVNATKQILANTSTTFMAYGKHGYSNVISGQPRLKLDKEGFQYIITVNNTGEATKFKITDGTYKVEGVDSNGIKVDGIGTIYEVVSKENVKYTLLEDGTFQEEDVKD